MKILIFLFSLSLIFTDCNFISLKEVYDYNEVDILPSFGDSENDLEHFVNDNLMWPSPEFGYSGKVICKVRVKKNGDVEFLAIERSLCPQCDIEAKRLINIMPKWKPAIKDGKKVSCIIFIPVKFEIDYLEKN